MSGKYKKVLHVDDEQPIRDIVASLLELHEVEVVQAGDPVEAVKILENSRADIGLIISDFMMPQKSGLEFLEEIREKGWDTPFVFLSAFKSETNKVKAQENGSLMFIEKPFDGLELAQTVVKLLT